MEIKEIETEYQIKVTKEELEIITIAVDDLSKIKKRYHCGEEIVKLKRAFFDQLYPKD